MTARVKRQVGGTCPSGAAIAAIACLALALTCSPGLASCAPVVDDAPHEATGRGASRAAGDEALPALAGDYAYTLVEVVSKDAEANTLRVRALAWEADEPFAKSGIPAGETGEVSCANLVLFPAGIPDGHAVVVASPSDEAATFPIAAYSIEKPSWFEARLARADAVQP